MSSLSAFVIGLRADVEVDDHNAAVDQLVVDLQRRVLLRSAGCGRASGD